LLTTYVDWAERLNSISLPHLKASGDDIVINLFSIAGIVRRSGLAGYIFNDGYAATNRRISLLTER
jgi:3-oxoacyl-[acyl-carrier protein] reductase